MAASRVRVGGTEVKTLPRQFVTAEIETSGHQSVPIAETEGDNQIKVAWSFPPLVQ